MLQLDTTFGHVAVTVYGPTPDRATWRVNLIDLETGDVGRAFYATEADAMDAVNRLEAGETPEEFDII